MGYISSMIKFTSIFTLLLFILSPYSIAASESILDYLSPENRTRLYSDGEISRYFFDKEKPEYLFSTSYEKELLRKLSNLDISIGVESLYFLKYSDKINCDNVTFLSIYNTLLSTKTMKGIEYYSQSRKKMRVLFTESHEIISLESHKPVEDPVLEIIYTKLYINLMDLQYGST